MTEPRLVKVSDTGRGRDPKNPLCDLGDYEVEYQATLVSLIGKLSEWGQVKKDNNKCKWTIMTSLDIGEFLELGKGHTKHDNRMKSNGKKRNSMATIIMGQLYNWETNKVKYPTGASVSWNQLQDFEIISKEMATAFPGEYEEIKFVINAFDWNHK
jgi:hypothetical protein